jgi:hypothetical protein
MNKSQMTHIVSIARHLREQALEPALLTMKSIESLSYENAEYWESMNVELVLTRINLAMISLEKERDSILKDMTPRLVNL